MDAGHDLAGRHGMREREFAYCCRPEWLMAASKASVQLPLSAREIIDADAHAVVGRVDEKFIVPLQIEKRRNEHGLVTALTDRAPGGLDRRHVRNAFAERTIDFIDHRASGTIATATKHDADRVENVTEHARHREHAEAPVVAAATRFMQSINKPTAQRPRIARPVIGVAKTEPSPPVDAKKTRYLIEFAQFIEVEQQIERLITKRVPTPGEAAMIDLARVNRGIHALSAARGWIWGLS